MVKLKRETEIVIEGGRPLVRVFLKLGKVCEIWEYDWKLLLEMGLSPNWRANPQSIVIAPAALAKGAQVTVARVLMDAGQGQTVKYADGDRLNLRRENLSLVRHNLGQRRDRDFLAVRKEAA